MKFKTMTVAASEAECNTVLKMITDKYGIDGKYGPELLMDRDGDGLPMIIWEGGPFDWDMEVSCGMADEMPKGVWVEPINCYSVHIFKEVPNPDF